MPRNKPYVGNGFLAEIRPERLVHQVLEQDLAPDVDAEGYLWPDGCNIREVLLGAGAPVTYPDRLCCSRLVRTSMLQRNCWLRERKPPFSRTLRNAQSAGQFPQALSKIGSLRWSEETRRT